MNQQPKTLFGFEPGDRVYMYDGREKLRGEVVEIDAERGQARIKWDGFQVTDLHDEGQCSSIINETKGTTNGQAVKQRFEQVLESKRVWPPIFGS